MSTTDPNDSMTIRPATPADYDAIVKVWRAAGLSYRPQGRESREAFTEQLTRIHDLCLVALDGPRVVGVVLGSHDHRKGWINRLAVLPEYQRRGLAVRLARACEDALYARGIDITAVLIEPGNDASAALFEKLGYRRFPADYYRKLRRPDV